jgi:hypothetical protein
VPWTRKIPVEFMIIIVIVINVDAFFVSCKEKMVKRFVEEVDNLVKA